MAFRKRRSAKGFSARQKEILKAVAETLLPPAVGTPLQITEDSLVHPMEGFLGAMGAGTLIGYGTLLLFFEYAAVFIYPKFKPFTQLDPEDRERYMSGWESSRISYRCFIFSMLKFLVCFALLNDKDNRTALGYDTGCLVEK